MKEEIIEGNQLIAEFMMMSKVEGGFYPIEGQLISSQQLGFHSSWDWLMEVVEKIESIYDDHHGYFGVHISSNSCSIQGTNLHRAIENLEEYGWVYISDPNAILATKIESTWYNIVQFIKWYNSNQ